MRAEQGHGAMRDRLTLGHPENAPAVAWQESIIVFSEDDFRFPAEPGRRRMNTSAAALCAASRSRAGLRRGAAMLGTIAWN